MDSVNLALNVADVATQSVFVAVTIGLSIGAARYANNAWVRSASIANGSLAVMALIGTIAIVVSTDTLWLRHPTMMIGFTTFTVSISLLVSALNPPKTQTELIVLYGTPLAVTAGIALAAVDTFEIPPWLQSAYILVLATAALLCWHYLKLPHNTRSV